MEQGNEQKTGRKRTTSRFLQRPFSYLIEAISEKYKETIHRLINERQNIYHIAKIDRSNAGSMHKAELLHQRMQDNMSEIMD